MKKLKSIKAWAMVKNGKIPLWNQGYGLGDLAILSTKRHASNTAYERDWDYIEVEIHPVRKK